MDMGHITFLHPVCPAYQHEVYIDQSKKWYINSYATSSVLSHAFFCTAISTERFTSRRWEYMYIFVRVQCAPLCIHILIATLQFSHANHVWEHLNRYCQLDEFRQLQLRRQLRQERCFHLSSQMYCLLPETQSIILFLRNL